MDQGELKNICYIDILNLWKVLIIIHIVIYKLNYCWGIGFMRNIVILGWVWVYINNYYTRFLLEKSVNYSSQKCIVPIIKLNRFIIQYYIKRKYILLTNIFIGIFWYNVITNIAFVNIIMHGRLHYIGLNRYYIYVWKDLWYIKLCYLKKFKNRGFWKIYKRYKLFSVNLIVKIIKQIKFLRREWHKLFNYRLRKFKANKIYNIIYKRFSNNALLSIYNVYLFVMGSKLLLSIKWFKIYEFIYKYLNKWYFVSTTNNLYYIGLSKWYIIYWIFQFRLIKNLRSWRRRSKVIRRPYIWQVNDINQFIEVDYFTFTSFKLPIDTNTYLLYSYLFLYLHWEFINIYNWKYFY